MRAWSRDNSKHIVLINCSLCIINRIFLIVEHIWPNSNEVCINAWVLDCQHKTFCLFNRFHDLIEYFKSDCDCVINRCCSWKSERVKNLGYRERLSRVTEVKDCKFWRNCSYNWSLANWVWSKCTTWIFPCVRKSSVSESPSLVRIGWFCDCQTGRKTRICKSHIERKLCSQIDIVWGRPREYFVSVGICVRHIWGIFISVVVLIKWKSHLVVCQGRTS